MPKACIYAGFRHLFYRMALVWDIDADSMVEMIYRDSANEGEGHYEWQEQKYCC